MPNHAWGFRLLDTLARLPLAAPSLMSHHQRKELMRCARKGHVPRIKALLESATEFEFVVEGAMSPLMTAACAGHTEIVELLLDAGASPNLTADDGASALHWAASNGHHDIVSLLVAAGACVNARRESGPMPLHFAITHGHDAIAITLIEAGTSLDIQYLSRDIYAYVEWHGRHLVTQYLNQLPCRPTWISR